MANTSRKGKIVTNLIILAAVATAAVLGVTFYFSSSSIHSLLTENHKLNKAIHNLTEERQIGFATIKSQSRNELGQLQSLVRFVQTAPGNPDQIVSEQLFLVEGDVIHFDALIVKFTDQYVKDGKGRALYLWRRIHGEEEAPSAAQRIEQPGEAPERYESITQSLKLKNQAVFWEAIWDLANDPQKLSEYGVTAVYGNTIYTKMVPDKVYLFKIDATGQIYPDILNYQ